MLKKIKRSYDVEEITCFTSDLQIKQFPLGKKTLSEDWGGTADQKSWQKSQFSWVF